MALAKKTSEAAQILQTVLRQPFPDDFKELTKQLYNGVVLCKLISTLRPNVLPYYNHAPTQRANIAENIDLFLNACNALGVTETFDPPDLLEAKNLLKVMNCIVAVAIAMSSRGQSAQSNNAQNNNAPSNGSRQPVPNATREPPVPPPKPSLPLPTSTQTINRGPPTIPPKVTPHSTTTSTSTSYNNAPSSVATASSQSNLNRNPPPARTAIYFSFGTNNENQHAQQGTTRSTTSPNTSPRATAEPEPKPIRERHSNEGRSALLAHKSQSAIVLRSSADAAMGSSSSTTRSTTPGHTKSASTEYMPAQHSVNRQQLVRSPPPSSMSSTTLRYREGRPTSDPDAANKAHALRTTSERFLVTSSNSSGMSPQQNRSFVTRAQYHSHIGATPTHSSHSSSAFNEGLSESAMRALVEVYMPLEKMNLRDLLTKAENLGLDTSSLDNKSEIIRLILESELRKLTLKQLMEVCGPLSIDLGDADSKSDIIELIIGSVGKVKVNLPQKRVNAVATGGDEEKRVIDQGTPLNTKHAPKWIPDDNTKICMLCGIHFTLVIRRHHCRNCGKVLCADCCSAKRQLIHTAGEVRVCKICDEFLELDEARTFRRPTKRLTALLPTVLNEMEAQAEIQKKQGVKPLIVVAPDHKNFIGEHPELGPVIVSVESPMYFDESSKDEENLVNPKLRTLIKIKHADIWVFIPWNVKIEKGIKAALEKKAADNVYASKLATVKLHQVKHPDFPKQLVEFEQKLIPTSYKFGVLYCKDGQTTESEMFCNVDPSPEFEEFLDFLGERITLQGWTGYRGGLDVKNNTTGKTSVFTTFTGLNIMFHVSTLLPFTPNDPQQIERKRHLGNDVCVIIFKDTDNQPFQPERMKSEFNHIFAVITVDRGVKSPVTHYRCSFGIKAGASIAEPALPDPPIFEKGPIFHHFLMTKLLNSERATLQGPSFKHKVQKAKADQMKLLVDEFKNK